MLVSPLVTRPARRCAVGSIVGDCMENTLLLHIAAGCVALVAGFIALFVRKGKSLHRGSGTVFTIAMTVLGITALAVSNLLDPEHIRVGGVLPVYMAITGLIAMHELTPSIRRITLAMMIVGFVLAALVLTWGVMHASRGVTVVDGVPTFMVLFTGTIAAGAVIGDAALLRWGPWSVRARLARHLWRMCFALYIASGSFFMGQADVIPAALRNMPVLIAISVLPLLLMFVWLWRVQRGSARVMTRTSTRTRAETQHVSPHEPNPLFT
jgi:hypothetical protein